MGQSALQQQSLKFYQPDMSLYNQCERQQQCLVWSDTTSKMEIEEYTKDLASAEEWRQEANIFLMRLNQAYVVQAVHFRDSSVDELCSRSYSVSLFLERVRLRMCDVTDVPYPDVLHLYHAALSGFATLFRIFGYFQINERMIGINQDYKVKVWCNSNFAIASPNKQSSALVRGEKEMVQSIIRIIDVNTDSLSKLDSFVKRTQYKTKSTFREALKHLSDYSVWLGMEIPHYMERTKVIIQNGDSVTSSKKTSQASKKPTRLKRITKADKQQLTRAQKAAGDTDAALTYARNKAPTMNLERYGLQAETIKPPIQVKVHQPPYVSRSPHVINLFPSQFGGATGIKAYKSISPQTIHLKPTILNPEAPLYHPKPQHFAPPKRAFGHVRVQSSNILPQPKKEQRIVHASQQRQPQEQYHSSQSRPVIPVLELNSGEVSRQTKKAESKPSAEIVAPARIDCKTEHSSESGRDNHHEEILEKTGNTGFEGKLKSNRTHKHSHSQLPVGDINSRFLDTQYVYGATTAKHKKHRLEDKQVHTGQFRYHGQYNH